MNDRGMIKWQPFNSVINTNKIVTLLEKERNYIIKPSLSEEQLIELNNKVLDAFYSKIKIKIKYYFNGVIYEKKGTITSINNNSKFIVINKEKINFSQILDIKI